MSITKLNNFLFLIILTRIFWTKPLLVESVNWCKAFGGDIVATCSTFGFGQCPEESTTESTSTSTTTTTTSTTTPTTSTTTTITTTIPSTTTSTTTTTTTTTTTSTTTPSTTTTAPSTTTITSPTTPPMLYIDGVPLKPCIDDIEKFKGICAIAANLGHCLSSNVLVKRKMAISCCGTCLKLNENFLPKQQTIK
uniref:ShKT domain-containing protein n=1 Tax=Meloidogyne incognita TaxID=6306 RepID=A0A914M6H8_MELIC